MAYLSEKKTANRCRESIISIQAASVGEAYLALELIRSLKTAEPLKILVTSNTRQGMEILMRNI